MEAQSIRGDISGGNNKVPHSKFLRRHFGHCRQIAAAPLPFQSRTVNRAKRPSAAVERLLLPTPTLNKQSLLLMPTPPQNLTPPPPTPPREKPRKQHLQRLLPFIRLPPLPYRQE